MPTRRRFLKTSLEGSTLIALAPTVPGFLARTARAAASETDGRVLVVVQLDGGNDGINTVVPFADEGYARARKALRLPDERLIKIDERVALHPSMRGAGALLESGRLAIVPGVGYPNPSRSHFRSMAIWQSARLDPEEHGGAGWIGQGLDAAGAQAESLFVGTGGPPPALRGRRALASTLEKLEDLTLDAPPPASRNQTGAQGDDLSAFVRRSTLDAYAASDRMAALARGRDSDARYPSSALAGRLRTIARLLKGGHRARVFYTSQGGYDTHAAQLNAHAGLLFELSDALKAFLDDLQTAGLSERVIVLGFSEFGRRVAENSSAGTDHGTAGPVLIAGARVQSGIVGTYPSLSHLVDGDLTMTVDFRRVYATVLKEWLKLPTEGPLGGIYEPLPILRT